jgi:HK97 family phage major capsid protein/HK97 family phage prohead protease
MATIEGVEIDLMPTEGMREEAQRYRDWKADGEAGGTEVAARRATQILSGDELSPDVVIEMNAWFARHEVDKQGEGFTPDEDGYPSAGRVAWAAWGGDAGMRWSSGKADRIKEIRDRSMDTNRAEPDELSVGDFVQWRSSGGQAKGKIDRIERDGSINVPDSEFTINGDEDDPAALITVYREGDEGWEETDVQVGHRFSALTKIAALRWLEGKTYQRSETTSIDEVEDRTFEFPFSSEYPVARYFGNEILSHDKGAADLDRLNDSAPLLFNHDANRVIGVVERAYMNDEKRKGYARVRFSRNEFAQQVLSDVKDGILRNVSFGYSIDKMEEREDGNFVATSWRPYELSVVSIPADPHQVGFGRSIIEDAEPEPAASAAITTPPVPEMENTTPDMEVVRAEAVEAERSRIAEVTSLCNKHGMEDLGRQLVESGRSINEARAAVLEKLNIKEEPVNMKAAEIGLSEKESRSFSFMRAINYLANPTDRAAREAAAFEIESSEAAADKLGRASRGITIPVDVMRRDLNVGTATAGGNLVETELDSANFIDLLRNASALDQAGATVLTGLSGNVNIPRQSGAATAYWVAESGSPTESQQTIDQVALTPKTCGAFTDFSRKLMIQSSIDVENMVRGDLAKVLALEIDRVGLYGSGSSNQPLGLKDTTGVLTEDFSANTPTFAEVVALESDVSGANALLGSPVYVMNAAMAGSLKTATKDSGSGQFILQGGEVNGYRAVISNQVASNDLWFGNFSDLIIAYFSGLDLMVDPFTGSTSGTVRVVALQDVDIAARHGASFSRGNNSL